MRAKWNSLHEQLVAHTSHLGFQKAFDRLRQSDPALKRFPDVAAVLDHQQQGHTGHDARREAISALIRAAQSVEPEAATLVLILALWPGLDAIYARLGRYARGDSAALASQLVSGVSDGILTCDLTRVRQPAATLLRNLERDMQRDLLRRYKRQNSHEVFDEFTVEPLNDAELVGPEAALDAASLKRNLRNILGTDADLVLAVLIEGLTQAEAATRFGIRPDATRKRYQRAIQKLAGIISG
jgi:hypothetical protein